MSALRSADKLKTASDRSFFLAIGDGHLYGPTGVPALLEKAGYKLARVTE